MYVVNALLSFCIVFPIILEKSIEKEVSEIFSFTSDIESDDGLMV